LSSDGTFDHGSSILFPLFHDTNTLLAILCSRLSKCIGRTIINHTVNFGIDDLKDVVVPLKIAEEAKLLVSKIIAKQVVNPRYDYTSNEQLEIDQLVYNAYGLNETDIREVEDWYARRYPILAASQRKLLAAKQGQKVEQLNTGTTFNLFCDESRHLPHDREPIMLIGLLTCPADRAHVLNTELTALCLQYGLPKHFEIKWTKVSPGKLDFYRAVLVWFLATKDVSFRALVLPDKQREYARVPEDKREHVYYVLYYQLLRRAMEPENRYRAFLDIKDTRGREKLQELKQLLETNNPSQTTEDRPTLQHVRSHEIRLLQVSDLLLGAVGFARRAKSERTSPAKLALVSMLENKLDFSLIGNSPPGVTKVIVETCDALLL
jgi:hypothetical protein